MHRVGILLSGCGAHDGSDIHEVVLAALALERARVRVVYLAPEGPQADVVDHGTGVVEADAAPRDVAVESARLARGRMETFGPAALSGLGGLVVPGGLGVLKTLFTGLLVPGEVTRLKPALAEPIRALRAKGGVLAATGIAHAVFAALGEEFVADPFAAAPGEAVIDAARRLAWAPGFLGARSLDEAARGIDGLVRGVTDMLNA